MRVKTVPKDRETGDETIKTPSEGRGFGIALSLLRAPVDLYRSRKQWRSLVSRFGPLYGSKAFLRLRNPDTEVGLDLPQVSEKPIVVRTGTTDPSVFAQCLVVQEFDLAPIPDARLIVDGGAYVGYSSLFFANRFPGAQVIAVEPEPSNYRVLVRNTAHVGGILPVCAALWPARGRISIDNPGEEEWGFRVREGGPDGIPAVTIPDLMNQVGMDRIDILKLNIEGAEKELFERDTGWLDRVGVIIIELHDRFKPGCSESFYSATSGAFSYTQRPGLVLAIRKVEATPVRETSEGRKVGPPDSTPTEQTS